MIRLSSFLILLFTAISASGQIAFSRYFQESTIPAIENDTYLKIDFAWNLPGKIQASMNNGITELEDGNVNIAIKDFSEVIELSQSFLPAYYYRGVAYKKLHDLEKSEKDFLHALTIDAKSGETLIMLGEVYQQQSRFDKAEIHYEKGIAATSKQTRAYFNLGMIEVSRGNQKKAQRYFEKCLELDPAFCNAYLIQGLLKLSDVKRKNKDAFLYFDKALQKDSTHQETLFWRGLAYLYVNDSQNAIKDWNNLVKYSPGNTIFSDDAGVSEY